MGKPLPRVTEILSPPEAPQQLAALLTNIATGWRAFAQTDDGRDTKKRVELAIVPCAALIKQVTGRDV